jgi:CRISPR/Cas system endoribonuclease Cas6 (RAMP superfamily)
MFKFVVKYLGFLKQVPLLPHLFDSHLKLWLLLTNHEIMDCLDDLETEVLTWDGTSVSLHKFGGIQFNCKGKEIGHVHSNGLLDILFNRSTKQTLLRGGRISNHHVFKNTGWISFYIRKKADNEYAKKLLRMAYLKIQ